MFYCPKCMNIYNITKNIKTKEQLGGNNKLETIIEKILNNENLDDIKITQDDLDDLNKSSTYKKLQNKQKDYVFNYLNEHVNKKIINNNKTAQNMYFICKNCGNNELIKEGTLIASKVSSNNNSETNFNPKEYLQMKILPRTRQYDCPNEKCISHKQIDKKSAVFMRIPDSYKVRYICEACEFAWLIS